MFFDMVVVEFFVIVLGFNKYLGVMKILKVYILIIFVDNFGDVFFS